MKIASMLLGLFVATTTLAGPPLGIAPTALTQGELLQAVIDRGGPIVFVPKGTYQQDAPIRLRSNAFVLCEPGAVIEAAAGAFAGVLDSLVILEAVENVTIQGCTFRMRKTDYLDPVKYTASEFRHALDIRGSKNITVTDCSFLDSGGDGIYLGPLVTDDAAWANSKRHWPNQAVTIRRTLCDNNVRQGISVVACASCLIEECVLSRTAGKSPQAGIDVEPEYQDPIDVTIRRCKSEGNRGPAYMWSLQNVALTYRANNVTVNTPPVRIIMEGNTYNGVPVDQPTMRMTGIFSATAPTGYLCDNIPKGSVLQWNDLVWKK